MRRKDKLGGVAEESSDKSSDPELSLISNEKLLQLYAAMVRCRMLEARLSFFAPQNKSNGVRETAGWAASVAGATIDLVRGDAIVPRNIKLFAGLAKGAAAGTISKLAAGLIGHGSQRRSGASGLESAIQAARIRKRKHNSQIAVAFAEVEETILPAWRRSLSLAARRKLPIVFVVQAGIEDDRHPVTIAGLPVIVVDGHDAVAVYRVAFESIARARRGSGPTLIECRPYIVGTKAGERKERLRLLRGRTPEPRGADPIVNMEVYLQRKGLFTPELRQRIATAFGVELDAGGAVPRQPSG